MQRAIDAFMRAVGSQFHPRMLALLVLPLVVSLLLWMVGGWLLWAPVTEWLSGAMFGWSWTTRLQGWLLGLGFADPLRWLVALVAMILLLPLAWVTAMVLTAMFAMPVVLRHVAPRDYPQVRRRGTASPLPGLLNALVALAVFVFGYVFSLPLWLVPLLGLLVPWLWWSWLTARVMRLDSLVEFADANERETLIRAHRGGYLLLGMMVSALNYVPPLFLITPVLSALAYAHFSLRLLREHRGGRHDGGDVVAEDGRAASGAGLLSAPVTRADARSGPPALESS